MCPSCAKLNFKKRANKADLKGKIALVTGGRTKIGYEIVVSLLTQGATVYVTTRFPKNSLIRFQESKTYEEWKDRLHIVCLDFKITASIYEFCEYFKTQVTHLDIIISNAA
jgi:NAD(P)-dependent dehydrogenase (short-subunit alcohol dehydrogenase family)